MSWIRRLLRRKYADAANDSAPVEPTPKIEKAAGSIAADNPITKAKDDSLCRAKPAQSFADQIRALDSTGGVVVGVLGPWGSGKTSFVNLARGHLRESGVTVLEFNPWMFSGADQLVQAFL